MNIEVKINVFHRYILAIKTEFSIIITGFLLRSALDIELNKYIESREAKTYIIVDQKTNNYEVIARLIKVLMED